ncbi:MAG: hypothetical protein IKV97_04715 [Clostridia bacterium]|nr:hypothetical protein [Clostridia bacterium]
MGLIEKIKNAFNKKDENGFAFRMEMAQKLDGRYIKYVTERVEGVENVIGREGHSNIVSETEFAVTSGIDEIFRADIADLQAWELLNLEGAVLTAYDKAACRRRTVVIYYKYYR